MDKNITIFTTKGYSSIILLKKPNNSKYYAYTIDSFTGSLIFNKINNYSIFDDYKSAISFIESQHPPHSLNKEYGEALIGIARYGPTVYIMYVKSYDVVAQIHNRHQIKMITDVGITTINLPFDKVMSAKSQRRINRIKEFPIAGLHFYSDTLDLTGTSYSDRHAASFIWNDYLASPFAEIGERDACINMLQGCISSTIVNVFDNKLKITIITKREAKHGGTRYYARGLDETGHAANEVQIELIAETNKGKHWSYIVRRGSVPVTWKSVAAKNLPTVSISIEQGYDKLTPKYFEELFEQFEGEVFCLNLLHSNPGNVEKKLCEAYEKAISNISNTTYLEFDWHTNVKNLGIAEAVNNLYQLIGDLTLTHFENESTDLSDNFVLKPFPLFENELNNPEFSIVTGNNVSTQNKLVRINCMDSLDRTNVGSFFVITKAISQILNGLNNSKIIETYEELLQLPIEIRNFLAESFITIGNCISTIYTNTPACMTEFFISTAQLDLKTISDSQIAIQRRFHNFVTDIKRQKSFWMICGQKLDFLLPNIICGQNEKLVSSFPSCIIPPIFFESGIEGVACDPNCLLSFQQNVVYSINPSTILIMLNEFCYITSVVIIVVPPSPPSILKIYSALTHGPRNLLVNKFALPSDIQNPTPLYIPIPPDFCNGKQNLARYIYLEFEGYHLDRAIATYSLNKSAPLSISNIYVYGNTQTSVTDITRQCFPTTYIEINENSQSPAQLGNIETTPPGTLLKTTTEFNVPTILQFEMSRLIHKIGHLELCSKILADGLDPLLYDIKRYLISSSGNEVTPGEKCASCGIPAEWKCFSCHKAYCNHIFTNDGNEDAKQCNEIYTVENPLYCDGPSIICKECYEKYNAILEEYNSLSSLYNDYFTLALPSESPINHFIHTYLSTMRDSIPSIAYPSVFPYAFFTTADDPKLNLVLTKDGGEMKCPVNLQLSLYYPTNVHNITVNGSDNLHLIIKEDNTSHINEIDIVGPKSMNCNLQGQFFHIILKEGTLTHLMLEGDPIITQVKSHITKKITLTRKNSTILRLIDKMKPKHEKSKNVQELEQRRTTVELPSPKEIEAFKLQDMNGIYSILLGLYNNINEKPVYTDFYYIPKGLSAFKIFFKKPISAKFVSIEYYDIDQTFTEPKVFVY